MFTVRYYLSLQKNDHKLIINYTNKGRVLDIGAGRGDMLELLGFGWDRWAFDPYISDKDKNILKSKIGNQINNYKSLQGYPNSHFDLIILRNVIEHTTKFDILVKNISKKIKKGGYFFIRTPNTNALDFKIFENKWWVVNMPGHMVFFDERSINLLLKKHGFKIREINADKKSSMLSYYRSKSKAHNKPMGLVKSVMYSFLSQHLGEGGDITIVAQKT